MHAPRSLKRQAGLSTIDVLIGIGVLIIIIGLVLSLGRFAGQQVDSMKTSVWHSQLVERAVGAYKPQGNCQGVSSTTLVDLKAVPKEMLSGGTILDAWGGAVQVSTITTVVANDTLVITYPAVGADECASFAQQIEGKHFRLDVGGTAIKNTTTNLGFNVGNLASACAGSSTKQVITYTRCR